MTQQIMIKNNKINFCCKMDACKNCCCGVFNGITKNLVNVDRRPFDEIVLTDEDFDRLYKSGLSNLIEQGFSEHMEKPYYRMSLNPDGSCKAFKNGKCSINKYKPTLCRAFPFYFDMFSGLCAVACEGFTDRPETDMDEMKGCIDAAKKMYRFWIQFYSFDDDGSE